MFPAGDHANVPRTATGVYGPKMEDSTFTGKAKELSVLRISSILTVVFAVVGIVIAIVCDSLTLIVDALYSVVDVIVSVLAIFVAHKIQEPPNLRYHYGYAKYEPFMTAVDGLLIMAICAGSIVLSIQEITHPEPVKHIELIIIFSFISVFICIGFGHYMRSTGRKISSEILKADGELWIIEGFITAGVCVAFGLSDLISYTVWNRYADYVDPITSIVLCLGLLYQPVRIVWESFQDLVDARPDDKVHESIVREMAEKHGLSGVAWIKARKAGRKIFLTVCYRTEQNRCIKELDDIRIKMESEVRANVPEMEVDVHFRS
jgi:cation diffusion facilitator family transporter